MFNFNSIRSGILIRADSPGAIPSITRWSFRRPNGRSWYHAGRHRRGIALAIRKKAFDDVGGFDPRYFLYFEEYDLCRRLLSAGWHTYCCGDATVVHLGQESTDDRIRFTAIWGASRKRYLNQHWPWPRRVVLYTLQAAVFAWNELLRFTAHGALEPDRRSEKLMFLAERYATANALRLAQWTRRRANRHPQAKQ